ncbi:PAS domain-containing protein [Jannaschia sp. W003]|uniref:PAS domain-containing protein n=1 Tax=Jannaschia sp. W003 TaxID=2867012 RepID=UPI0021A45032|nr:PAS domain-containing protein [Jannaschia sp. W003]UWQ21499.1 PAS domain-containing protein [Jannaschia sp. W003]
MRSKAIQDSIKNNPVAMVLSDPGLPDNPLVFVNDAFERSTLYNRDAAIGQNCRFLQCDETDPETRRVLREAIAERREVTVDILNQKADGTKFLNRVVIAPLRDEDGEVHAFLGIQSEIRGGIDDQDSSIGTQSLQMLRELQHRVKNHLSMVVSLIRMQSKSDVTRESFEALSHRVQSLALLYEELSPAGIVGRDSDTLPAGAYLSRVANTIAALDGRAAIRVNVSCDEVELPVEVGARLGLILTELITNALEHAFAGRAEGVIHVRFTRQTRGKLRLTVEDDGVGMPEGSQWPKGSPSVEAQRRRAEAQDAAGETLDTRSEGHHSGLGGSIVAAMIGNLAGDLTVSSSEHGTVVHLDFAEAV